PTLERFRVYPQGGIDDTSKGTDDVALTSWTVENFVILSPTLERFRVYPQGGIDDTSKGTDDVALTSWTVE
ncbi:hypothetical protein, partial [Chryseobacterium sp. CH25]|uniref:hypothetical protein n=1 Tax=Chryseobacterium sp. CH25 TaxID=713559 RepID=UPI001024E6C5